MKKAKEKRKNKVKSFYSPVRINKGIVLPSGKDNNTDVLFGAALSRMTPTKVW